MLHLPSMKCLSSSLPWLSSVWLLSPQIAQALPVVDGTLGSQLRPGLPSQTLVEGGTAQGQNLFHSFDSFDISETEAVYFVSPADINHIFGRVTGSTPSQIDGVLGTVGSPADLFLMNPNGVMFGPTASLDVQGSLIVTTADAIGFGETGQFSTDDTTADQLVTIDPSAFLFTEQRLPASIEVQSQFDAGSTAFNAFGLNVPLGENIVFVGGDIQLEGDSSGSASGLYAPGGRIEIVAVAEPNSVLFDANQHTLTPALKSSRADITLNNNAAILTVAQTGGDISLYANNVNVSGSSRISTGIVNVFGTNVGQAGELTIDSTGVITLDSSLVGSVVSGFGGAGNITVRGQEISLNNGSQISSAGTGVGNAGNVTLEATRKISFSGRNPNPDNPNPSGVLAAIGSFLGSAAQGDGGDITVTAPHVELYDGALISSSVAFAPGNAGDIGLNVTNLSLFSGSQLFSGTNSVGNAGNITVQATGAIILDGIEPTRSQRSGLTSSTQGSESSGNGGDITLTAQSLILRNGAIINASTGGQGDTGNVLVDVEELLRIEGTSPDGQFPSVLGAQVNLGATGNGKLVRVEAGALELVEGGSISSSTLGNGSAGRIEIDIAGNALLQSISENGVWQSGVASIVGQAAEGNGGTIGFSANNLVIENGAAVNASTSGKGRAGNIDIDVQNNTTLRGTNESETLRSGIFGLVFQSAEGNGGTINISTVNLSLLDGAVVNASTQGNGDTGDIVISVNDLLLIEGTSSVNQLVSAIGAVVDTEATGNGKSIYLEAGSLELINGGAVISDTLGDGSAGNITVNIDGSALIQGSSENNLRQSAISSVVGQTAEGRGGTIRFLANNLRLLEGGVINASSSGSGNAGSVFVNIEDLLRIEGATQNSQFPSGIGAEVLGSSGNSQLVRLEVGTLEILNGGVISSATFSGGSAGTVEVNATENILIQGNSADAFGNSGISRIAAFSQGNGGTGNIVIRSPELRILDNGQIVATSATVDGGNIILDLDNLLLLRNNSQITATAGTAQGDGDGGNITITVPFIVAIPEENSDIRANASLGNGGRVTIDATGVFGIEPREQPTPLSDITASSDLGVNGVISLTTVDTGALQNSLTELPENLVNPDALTASSCLASGDRTTATLATNLIDGLPQSPDRNNTVDYPTGSIQALTNARADNHHLDTQIIEPDGVYQLADGRLVMGRRC